jgi:hypothetical protein
MKYEYIGDQSITIHGIGEAGACMNPLNGYTPGAMGRISFGTPSEGARMSEMELPTDAEGQDLGWHALNYRTAHTVHAQAMYEELERYVRAAILAERERCAKVCEELPAWNMDDPGESAAAAIRRGSV